MRSARSLEALSGANRARPWPLFRLGVDETGILDTTADPITVKFTAGGVSYCGTDLDKVAVTRLEPE